MWFPNEIKDSEDMKEMLEELKYVGYTTIGSKHDDGLDLISQLGMIEYVLPVQTFAIEGEELTGADLSIWGSIWDKEDTTGSSVIF